jgi:hypothetical protein
MSAEGLGQDVEDVEARPDQEQDFEHDAAAALLGAAVCVQVVRWHSKVPGAAVH